MELKEIIKTILCEYIELLRIEKGKEMSLEQVINTIDDTMQEKYKIQRQELQLHLRDKVKRCEFKDACIHYMTYRKCLPKCKKIMDNLQNYMPE